MTVLNPDHDATTSPELPGVVTRLFKGVVYAEADEKTWQALLGLTSQVRDYVAVLGLDLILDPAGAPEHHGPGRAPVRDRPAGLFGGKPRRH